MEFSVVHRRTIVTSTNHCLFATIGYKNRVLFRYSLVMFYCFFFEKKTTGVVSGQTAAERRRQIRVVMEHYSGEFVSIDCFAFLS